MLPGKADKWEVFHCKTFKWGKFGFFAEGGGAAPSSASNLGSNLGCALMRAECLFYSTPGLFSFLPGGNGVQGTICQDGFERDQTSQCLRKAPFLRRQSQHYSHTPGSSDFTIK